MKKKDWIVMGTILAIALVAMLGVYLYSQSQAGEKEYGVVYYRDQVIIKFDINKDKVYEFTGDYGHMELHVQDGKWCITNEECPNHICSSMGWASSTTMMPITCIPNNVYVLYQGADE